MITPDLLQRSCSTEENLSLISNILGSSAKISPLQKADATIDSVLFSLESVKPNEPESGTVFCSLSNSFGAGRMFVLESLEIFSMVFRSEPNAESVLD